MADIIFGPVFLFIGLTACAIAGISRRSGTRIFVWLGIWSALYGASQLSQSRVFLPLLPRWFQSGAPYASAVTTYLPVFPSMLSFRKLSLGKLRLLIQIFMLGELAIGIAGGALFIIAGSSARLMFYDQLFRAGMFVVLTTVVAVPELSSKYLVLPDRGVLAAGMLVFTVEALFNNLSHVIGYGTPRALDDLGFAFLLISFAYVALQLVLANERRLFAVERELSVAREIQRSILPSSVPELERLRISAVYRPMTDVAGDFYDFIAVDQNRAGFLVADVCGHGVPAALIASMIKVAVQTVVSRASDPGAVMRGLNRVLSRLLRGQLISAAYLWLDTESRRARYAAAGHPPLLLWRQGELERIESNGLLFGMKPEYEAYPVCAMPMAPGDRFLLYTDGVTEPENANGESFGDKRLEQVVRRHRSCQPAEFLERLLDELRLWQPSSIPQQDDITLIVIDAF
jgi:sigma-B regulation protein RsbU (phosphoserine phosphatase)